MPSEVAEKTGEPGIVAATAMLLVPPGRVGDPDSPCLSLWYDDPHPLYWVQVRWRWDRDILTCDQPSSPV